MGKRRRHPIHGRHGSRSKRDGADNGKGWGKDGLWCQDYLTAFAKARKKICVGDKAGEEEQRKVALLIGAKAEALQIRPDRAGKLAALLCEDFSEARTKLMVDLIENPGILKAARMVMEGKGLNDYEEAEDQEEAGQEGAEAVA